MVSQRIIDNLEKLTPKWQKRIEKMIKRKLAADDESDSLNELCEGDEDRLDDADCDRDAIGASRFPFEYQALPNGEFERVLAFNNDEHIVLKNLPAIPNHVSKEKLIELFKALHAEGPEKWPFFSSRGPLTNLNGSVLRGSRVETTFPVDPLLLVEQEEFPKEQPFPFDEPPVLEEFTKGNGYSKQAYFLNDEDSFVTVGPSLPKIVRLKGGGAQFWVGSIGVIAQGTGRFEGAKGVATYVGSGYLKLWPKDFTSQAPILAAGFKALIGTFVKVVLRDNLQ